MKLHDLRARIALPGSKLFPLWCVHCQKEISARNKAKVWQHVKGQDHRARWGQARREQEATKDEVEPKVVKEEEDEEKTGTLIGTLVHGICGAFVFSSELSYEQMQCFGKAGAQLYFNFAC